MTIECNINQKLNVAIQKNQFNLCKQLIKDGADVNFISSQGFPVLIGAVAMQNLEICELLLKHGADVNIKTRNGGYTALMWIAMKSFPIDYPTDYNFRENNIKLCELLLRYGANVNTKDANNCTALMFAIAEGSIDLCELLIENGANLNLIPENFKNRLLSMRKNKYEILRNKYKPDKRVKFLFVGESRPVSGEFFYINNTNLYTQTKEVFELLIKDFSREKFKKLGCWLYDVCSEPINQYNEKIPEQRELKRKIIRKNLPQLKSVIKELNPEYIIIVKKGLFGEEVLPEILSICDSDNVYNLPFPACSNQKKYKKGLLNILQGKIINDC